LRLEDAGAIDEDIERAKALHRGLDDRAGRIVCGQFDSDWFGLDTALFDP
jgi:hypothetical protein